MVFFGYLLVILAGLGALGIEILLTQYVWNIIIVYFFGFPSISFLQALVIKFIMSFTTVDPEYESGKDDPSLALMNFVVKLVISWTIVGVFYLVT